MQFSHSLGLETEPFKSWDNIVCKTMGFASQRITWRKQVKENFVKRRKPHCKDSLFLMEKTTFF